MRKPVSPPASIEILGPSQRSNSSHLVLPLQCLAMSLITEEDRASCCRIKRVKVFVVWLRLATSSVISGKRTEGGPYDNKPPGDKSCVQSMGFRSDHVCPLRRNNKFIVLASVVPVVILTTSTSPVEIPSSEGLLPFVAGGGITLVLGCATTLVHHIPARPGASDLRTWVEQSRYSSVRYPVRSMKHRIV
jgi:hypothetical protein